MQKTDTKLHMAQMHQSNKRKQVSSQYYL